MVKTRPSTATLPTMPITAHRGVSSFYVASAQGGTGKSTIALGLLHLLAASAARVGVFKPVVRSTDEVDDLLDLLVEQGTATVDDFGQLRGVTHERVDDDPEAALSEIVAGYHELAQQCDAVVVIGSDHTDVFNPSALTFDARIAANLEATVLLVVNGHDRNAETITQIAQRCLTDVVPKYDTSCMISRARSSVIPLCARSRAYSAPNLASSSLVAGSSTCA
jgi:phosphate acetyltransferase